MDSPGADLSKPGTLATHTIFDCFLSRPWRAYYSGWWCVHCADTAAYTSPQKFDRRGRGGDQNEESEFAGIIVLAA
jgi:hypothetical protein